MAIVGHGDDEPAIGITSKRRSSSELPAPQQKRRVLRYDMPRDTVTSHTDLFETQVEELLSELRPKSENCVDSIAEILREIKTNIERLPDQKPLPFAEAERNLKQDIKVALPFVIPEYVAGKQDNLEYSKPKNINVIGSASTRTILARNGMMVADMVVSLPSHIFQDKDYLDYRYFHKRAYYLAYIAGGLNKAFAKRLSVRFSLQNDNHLQPIIVIDPSDDEGNATKGLQWQVRVLAAIDTAPFSAKSVSPWGQCIRNSSESREQLHKITPFYNSTLRSEATTSSYLRLLHKTATRVPAFRDASLLLAVWLRQRGLGSNLSQGGFGTFEATAIMAVLLQEGGPKGQPYFPPSFAHHQLFKAFLNFLTTRDLLKNPMFLGVHQPERIGYPLKEVPVLFDGPREHNLLFRMSSWSYRRLQHEAVVTTRCIRQTELERFEHCFITKIDNPLLRDDDSFRVTLSQPHSLILDSKGSVADACNTLYSTLSFALRDRVRSVFFSWAKNYPWNLNVRPRCGSQVTLDIRFLLKPESVTRLLDHGPPVEEKDAAAAFRKFWGEKAELRRFKDGSISETAVWSEDTNNGSVLSQIVSYALARHEGQELAASLQHFEDNLWQSLPATAAPRALTIFMPTLETFEGLSRHIREIEGLPLRIRQISPASSALRYSRLHVPNLDTTAHEPISIVLQFESSTRWPDDLTAIQKIKIALLVKLGELLERTSAYRTKVGLENESRTTCNPAFLDICTADICFRLRIYHDREEAILKSQLSLGSTSSSFKENMATAIALYRKTFTQAPAHTQVVRGLSTQFPLLSPTMRMLKGWCSYHLLLPHLDEELIELLAVKTFTDPYPYDTPGSLRTAFLRTISTIARWNWRAQPLLVPFNHGFSTEEKEGFQTRFEAWRQIDPAMNRVVLFVGTTVDLSGLAWTEEGPTKVIAARLCALAQATLARASSQDNKLDARPLLTTRLNDYDFLIHTNNQTIRTPAKQNNIILASLKAFVKQLEGMYGESILFFYDGVQMAVIAGLWKPAAEDRTWKVNLSYSTVPITRGFDATDNVSHVTANREAILHEMARLGTNLISKIEIFSK